MAERVGWGIVGTGGIANTFARDLALLPEEADLVAVSSRRQSSAEAFARQHGVRRGYTSVADLATDPDVDVVYVGSVHNDHYPAARACLEGGKAVLVEKPLTLDPADSAALVDLARERGLFLMEAMWTRCHPLIRQAAELVSAGEIGEVRHVSADFGFAFDGPEDHRLLDPGQAGGAIWDAGVYPVHAVNLILGEPDQVLGYGWLGPTGVDVHAGALLTYKGQRGPATAGVLCTLQAHLESRLAVYATQGRIMIDDFFLRPAEMTVHRGRDNQAEAERMVTQWPGGGYTFEAQEVMRCLRAGETESPMVPWSDTLAVSRTLAAWKASVGPVTT